MAERESKRPRRVEEESVSEEDGDNDTTTDAVISAFEAFERAELELADRVLTNAANIPRRLKRLLPAGEIDRQCVGFEQSARQNAAFVNAVLAHAQRAGFCDDYDADGGGGAALTSVPSPAHTLGRALGNSGKKNTKGHELLGIV